jgi:hypothetical protein
LADLKGGTSGQVLAKNSNTDMDFVWVAQDDSNAIQNAIVDAKGDLIAASANDTPARLAVGNNGETLVADSSTSTGLRYNPQNALANPVINGGFDIWERGTTFTDLAANTYCADRWTLGRPGNVAGQTVTREATGDTTNLPNIQYAARSQRTAGNTSTAGCYLAYAMESVNSIPFAGKTVTYSFYARRGANYSAASNGLTIKFDTSTGTDQTPWGSLTGAVAQVSQDVTLTTSWQRFVFTFTVPTNSTQLTFFFLESPTGTAGANDWYEVTGVQIDLGTYTASTAPTFRRSQGTIQGELSAAQRYYWRDVNQGTGSQNFTTGLSVSTQIVYFGIQFPVTMRTIPTLLDNSGIGISSASVGYSGGTTIQVANQSSTTAATLSYTHTSAALTNDRSYLVQIGPSGFLGFSAEL